MVLEYFEARGAACRDLARAFFSSSAWAEVARQSGRTPEAVRQQWLRCCEALRAFAKRCPDLLLAWSRMQEDES